MSKNQKGEQNSPSVA